MTHPSFRRPRPARGAGSACAALLALTILAPAPAGAFASRYRTMTLVWSRAGGACAAVPMALVADHVWSAPAAIPRPDPVPGDGERVEFQFMVDGDMQPAHFGHGGPGPLDLAFGADPPSLVVTVGAYGYSVFTLDEVALSCSVAPADGSARVTVGYENTPEPVPEPVLASTRVELRDETLDQPLGTFRCSPGIPAVSLTCLLPAHRYHLAVSADGYTTRYVTFLLPDTGTYGIIVSLSKSVPAAPSSWGAAKVLYR